MSIAENVETNTFIPKRVPKLIMFSVVNTSQLVYLESIPLMRKFLCIFFIFNFSHIVIISR